MDVCGRKVKPSQLKRGREWDEGFQTIAKFHPTAHFFQKQWKIMVIAFKSRFHQQPYSRPRWTCPLYSWGSGHDDHLTYQACGRRNKPRWVLIVKASDTGILCKVVSVMSALQETGLRQLWIVFGQGQGHLLNQQSRDVMLLERRCDVSNEITDVFNKPNSHQQ